MDNNQYTMNGEQVTLSLRFSFESDSQMIQANTLRKALTDKFPTLKQHDSIKLDEDGEKYVEFAGIPYSSALYAVFFTHLNFEMQSLSRFEIVAEASEEVVATANLRGMYSMNLAKFSFENVDTNQGTIDKFAKMEEIVAKHVSNYQNDFYIHDISQMLDSNDTKFIWAVRDTGTWLIPETDAETSTTLEYVMHHETPQGYYHIDTAPEQIDPIKISDIETFVERLKEENEKQRTLKNPPLKFTIRDASAKAAALNNSAPQNNHSVKQEER